MNKPSKPIKQKKPVPPQKIVSKAATKSTGKLTEKSPPLKKPK